MNRVAKTNLFAVLFLILGGVWGTFLVVLGIPKVTVAWFSASILVVSLVALLVGPYLVWRSKGEDSEGEE